MTASQTEIKVSRSISVFVKALFLIAGTAAVVAAVPAFQSSQMLTRIVLSQVTDHAEVVSHTLANSSASAVRFKKYDKLLEEMDTQLTRDADILNGMLVFDASGSAVGSVGALDEARVSALSALATQALETGLVQENRASLLWAVPVVMGAGDRAQVVGVIASDWTAQLSLKAVYREKIESWITAGGVFVVLLLFGAFFLRRWISRPLVDVTQAMKKVSEGDLDAAVPHRNVGDEVGQMARALETQRLSLIEAMRLDEQAKQADSDARAAADKVAAQQAAQQSVVEQLSVALHSLAEGDLTKPIETTFDPEYEGLREDYNTTLGVLRNAMSVVRQNADGIESHSNELSESSDELARRTENQAATLEETAASLGELTKSVTSTAQGAKEVEGIVLGARADAEASGEVVRNAVDAMTQINESSNQIGQIINVIEDITFQTNLLALNAGVEAARAGEAGKGFAVVATEVRALAHRSSEAATEIKTLIDRATSQVGRGVDLVNESGTALENILKQVSNISSHVTEIAGLAAAQSDGLNEINDGIAHLDNVTQQNVAMVEEATAATHSLKNDAQELSNLVSKFRSDGGSSSSGDRYEITSKVA
ncbi:Methyl-accepting chemotaxis protein [Candidatus Rhodobacter oscarellae]|uniref:Methyl-accepting chemotaxis protein n=1 Tax=Candidatus Rhodobacter oscarellae TaxID=1675527 RepID=A0A0J9EA09_9RHOB|nr:HAMP domain-containing methyl-accepting chemotaxis protein [Candidatus Rhodobacter lobularis]KMW59607.1 Methyl-accepting chemotaxis protein [Candidatus Rhodobacter lobularis]